MVGVFSKDALKTLQFLFYYFFLFIIMLLITALQLFYYCYLIKFFYTVQLNLLVYFSFSRNSSIKL